MTTYQMGSRHWVVAAASPHTHKEQPMRALAAVPMTEDRPYSVQSRASLHERAVQKVARDEHDVPKGRRSSGRRTGRVQTSQMHPAYKMAHALGIPREHVQIIESGDRWSCVIWNHPAPWPGESGD